MGVPALGSRKLSSATSSFSRNVLHNERRRRTIEVVKLRGAPHRSGERSLSIDGDAGIGLLTTACPRLHRSLASGRRACAFSLLGIGGMDGDMVRGGRSRTRLRRSPDPTGTGKTRTSLSSANAVDPLGLATGACSTPPTTPTSSCGRPAAGWGLDLDTMEAPSGLLQVAVDHPEVGSLEDHFLKLRRAILEFAPDRLVIYMLSALERIATPLCPARLIHLPGIPPALGTRSPRCSPREAVRLRSGTGGTGDRGRDRQPDGLRR